MKELNEILKLSGMTQLNESVEVEGKHDNGANLGKLILKNLKSYGTDAGFTPEDFATAENIANIYISKGERAGLMAQDKSGMSDEIDDLLNDSSSLYQRTIRDLDDQGVDEGKKAALDYDKVLEAIAALYGPDIYDNDAMGDLADDLEQANPTTQELEFIIQKGRLPMRLRHTKFTNNDDIQFGTNEGKKIKQSAIAKKIGDVEEGLAELADLLSLAGLKGKVELDELANEPGQGTKETTTYSVSDVIDQGNDLHAKSKQYADKAKLGDNPMATEEVDVVENKLWRAYQAELAGVKK